MKLKRILTFLLSLLMILSALPMAALAETEPTVAESTPAAETTPTTETTVPEETAEAEEEKPKVDPLGSWNVVTPPHELRTKSARIERLRHAIRWDYQSALEKEEAESLRGYCGLLASYQMYNRGINSWRECYDGKDYFDQYSKVGLTGGGYAPVVYPAQKETQTVTEETTQETTEPTTGETTAEETTATEETKQEKPKDTSMLQILNKITNYGKREVYNVLICFEKTNTEAGQKFGHVLFIYGIIDGVLYFTEGGNMLGAEGGDPIECTISQFYNSYSAWTEFEGIIVFGCKDYMDNCASYKSDMFATCVSAAPMQAMPYQTEETQPLRMTMPGERLHVIGLYENRENQYYYQIDDGETIGYVEYSALERMLFVHEAFALTDPKLPETLTQGKDFSIDGAIESPGELLGRVEVQILDGEGTVQQRYTTDVDADGFDLGNYRLNQALHFEKLEEGAYTLRVIAVSKVAYMMGDKLAHNLQFAKVAEQSFSVGAAPRMVQPQEQPAKPTVKDGWIYENGTWYCYNQGAPRIGWVEDGEIRYYLQADGSVTTGWAVIEEQERLFTVTGALRTGWVTVAEGKKYMDRNGVAVVGWQKIDDVRHYFNENGIWSENHAQMVMGELNRIGQEVAADLGVELGEKPARLDPSKKQPLK